MRASSSPFICVNPVRPCRDNQRYVQCYIMWDFCGGCCGTSSWVWVGCLPLNILVDFLADFRLGLIRCNQVNPRGDHEGLYWRSSNVQNF